MDPLRLAIALAPLAAYLLLIGALNLRSRPLVTTGARDLAVLGLGLSGFVVVGPLTLFLPEAAAQQLGSRTYVWLLMLVVYGLGLLLLCLSLRPRLVLYNMHADQLHRVLARVAEQLDKQAQWAGECLVLPGLGVQLHVEPPTPLRCAQLVAAGARQNSDGWRRLERALAAELRGLRGTPNPYGAFLVGFALLLLAGMTLSMIRDPHQVAQALREMLQP